MIQCNHDRTPALASRVHRGIAVTAKGRDSIDAIELIRNGRVIGRCFPEDLDRPAVRLPGRAICRIQYGWGPWAALGLDTLCQWDMNVRIEGGRFLQVVPCWQSGPFHEELRYRLERVVDS
jgi:hypothetical protein